MVSKVLFKKRLIPDIVNQQFLLFLFLRKVKGNQDSYFFQVYHVSSPGPWQNP